MVNIYVGNLPFDLTEAELEGLFTPHGQVQRVNLIMDRETGRPRGFGFVEMPDEAAANAAISALDGSTVGSRRITVNVARPREPRGGGYGRDRGDRGGGGGGYGRGGGGGGYGGGGGGWGRGEGRGEGRGRGERGDRRRERDW